jgi:hypothetical protein
MTTIRDIYNDRMDEFMPEYSFTEQDEVITGPMESASKPAPRVMIR